MAVEIWDSSLGSLQQFCDSVKGDITNIIPLKKESVYEKTGINVIIENVTRVAVIYTPSPNFKDQKTP